MRPNLAKQKAPEALPLLRKAARAKVEYYLACREIERGIIGYDAEGLDDAIDGLAFGCNLPEDADQITEKQAFDVLKHVRRER